MATATFTYEGRLKENDEVFDGDRIEEMTITFGRSQVMPPLEAALAEMEIGEEREVEILAEEGFGVREDKAIQKVLLQDIPNGKDLPVGEYILWHNPVSEKPLPVKVISKLNGIVELDFNHPLAGRDLIYWVKLTGKED